MTRLDETVLQNRLHDVRLRSAVARAMEKHPRLGVLGKKYRAWLRVATCPSRRYPPDVGARVACRLALQELQHRGGENVAPNEQGRRVAFDMVHMRNFHLPPNEVDAKQSCWRQIMESADEHRPD